MTLEEMLAREAIRYTISVYNRAVDEGLSDKLAEAFVEDAVMNMPGGATLEGRDAIVTALNPGAGRSQGDRSKRFHRHNVTSSTIDMVDADHASSRHYVMVVTQIGLDHVGAYDDRFCRVGDRWLIEERTVHLEWVHPESRFVRWLGAAQPGF